MPRRHAFTKRLPRAGQWLFVCVVAALGVCLILWALSYWYYFFVQKQTVTGLVPTARPGVQDYAGHDTSLVFEAGYVTLDRWHFLSVDRYQDQSQMPAASDLGWRGTFTRNTAKLGYFKWQNSWKGVNNWSFLGVAWSRGPSNTQLGDDWEFLIHFRTLCTVLALVTAAIGIPLRRALRRERREARGECIRCGYDRRGTAPGAACPECGVAPSIELRTLTSDAVTSSR